MSSSKFTPRRVLIREHSQSESLKEWPDPVPMEVTPASRMPSVADLVRAEVSRILSTSDRPLAEGAADPSPRDPVSLDWSDFDDDGDEFGLSESQVALMARDHVLEARQAMYDSEASDSEASQELPEAETEPSSTPAEPSSDEG